MERGGELPSVPLVMADCQNVRYAACQIFVIEFEVDLVDFSYCAPPGLVRGIGPPHSEQSTEERIQISRLAIRAAESSD